MVGTWLVTEATCDDGETSVTFGGEEVSGVSFTYFWDDINDAQLTLASDNTSTSSGSYTQVMTATTTAQGVNLGTQVTETPVDYSGTANWESNGDVLSLEYTSGGANGGNTGNDADYDIISLTSNTMHLRLNVTVSSTQSGATNTTSQTLNIFFEKQ